MENSMLFARLLGSYCIIVAVGILFNRKTYQKVMADFCQNSALLYIGGMLSLLFGLFVVLFHNGVANWAVIITIFGWGGIIKGAWLIIFPNAVAKFIEVYQKNVGLLMVHSFIIAALGIFLMIMGF